MYIYIYIYICFFSFSVQAQEGLPPGASMAPKKKPRWELVASGHSNMPCHLLDRLKFKDAEKSNLQTSGGSISRALTDSVTIQTPYGSLMQSIDLPAASGGFHHIYMYICIYIYTYIRIWIYIYIYIRQVRIQGMNVTGSYDSIAINIIQKQQKVGSGNHSKTIKGGLQEARVATRLTD